MIFIVRRRPSMSKKRNLLFSGRRKVGKKEICYFPAAGKWKKKKYVIFRRPESRKKRNMLFSGRRKVEKKEICHFPAAGK